MNPETPPITNNTIMLAKNRKAVVTTGRPSQIVAIQANTATALGTEMMIDAPLKNDIGALGTLTKNLNDSEAIVEHFIQFMPQKASTMTRTADYGSWFNFFLCEAKGSVSLPPLISQPIDIPLLPVNRARCSS